METNEVKKFVVTIPIKIRDNESGSQVSQLNFTIDSTSMQEAINAFECILQRTINLRGLGSSF